MPESERPRSLADTALAVAPRMMSGQFPDELLDPALRELEEKYGVVLDRDALRERLEQGVGFADYGKYARQQFLEGLRLIEKEGLRISTDKGIFLPAELAVAYSITSSARSSSDGGIVRPSALAVLRLMISANFVGCSIGRSAGLAPCRILTT